MKEGDNILIAFCAISLMIFFILGIYQFVQTIQWLWLHVEITIK